MAASGTAPDQAWGELASLGDEEREGRMLQRYLEIGAMEEAERQERMLAMASAEYTLEDAVLRSFTRSRLRAWLKLDEDAARKVISSYDAVMLKVPGPQAMRRVALDQTLARDFSPDDQKRLVALAPKVFGGAVPGGGRRQPDAIPATAPTQPPAAKKSRWPFRKG